MMHFLTQLSIFVRNRPGELLKVTTILAENGIDIRAITVAETSDFGILRVIVNDPDKAAKILADKGIMVGKTEVMAIAMKNRTEGLNEIATILANANCNIEYLYAFNKASADAVLLLQVSNDQRENAYDALLKHGVKIFSAEEINNM